MKIAPCKNCEERHFKCHADCSRYQEWAVMVRSERGALKKDRRETQMVGDVLKRSPMSPRGGKR